MDNGEWNGKQARAAILLAAGSTVRDTALEVDAGERTVHTWLDDPKFKAFVASIRDHVLDGAIGKLTHATSRAADVLTELLDSKSDHVRLRAAVAVFDSMFRAREHAEFALRISELERKTVVETPPRIQIPATRFHAVIPAEPTNGTTRVVVDPEPIPPEPTQPGPATPEPVRPGPNPRVPRPDPSADSMGGFLAHQEESRLAFLRGDDDGDDD